MIEAKEEIFIRFDDNSDDQLCQISETFAWPSIRLSGKFLSFHKETIDAQYVLFYIPLMHYLFYPTICIV